MNKLLILDGNSVLHRAYYAMPEWRNRSGEATSGVYGFLSMLLKAIEDLKPTHLAVVFDHPSPTFRHTMYVGYQTNREKDRQISEDIWGQIDKLKIVLEKMSVPVFQVSGFEADDVIGTLSRQATNNAPSRPPLTLRGGGCDVVIITGDRDLMQLVNDRINLYMPLKGLSDTTIVDRNMVMQRLGVWPEQVIDYKALVGDGSDNYPGVTGIGPKTAIDLLSTYKTFDEIYKSLVNNAPSNPPLTLRGGRNEGVVKKLIAGYEGGELSKRLATIRTDAPVTLKIDDCKIPDQDKIVEVLKELGHKSLIKRVSGEDVKINDNQPKLFE